MSVQFITPMQNNIDEVLKVNLIEIAINKYPKFINDLLTGDEYNKKNLKKILKYIEPFVKTAINNINEAYIQVLSDANVPPFLYENNAHTFAVIPPEQLANSKSFLHCISANFLLIYNFLYILHSDFKDIFDLIKLLILSRITAENNIKEIVEKLFGDILNYHSNQQEHLSREQVQEQSIQNTDRQYRNSLERLPSSSGRQYRNSRAGRQYRNSTERSLSSSGRQYQNSTERSLSSSGRQYRNSTERSLSSSGRQYQNSTERSSLPYDTDPPSYESLFGSE